MSDRAISRALLRPALETKISPVQIGNLSINVPVMLAPMAGYTNPPFRNICRKLGSGLNFTEMVPAEGIRRRLPQTMVYLETLPDESPIGAHIYGSDPDAFAFAAETIESLGRFDLIDINCGCPVRKIAGKGAGVSLMRDPEKIYTIVQKVSESTSLPVTVKTRIGTDPDQYNIPEVAQAIEEGGASAVFLHARFAVQRHSGPVSFAALLQTKKELSIPVIGNGGITNALQATEMMQRTGVDGIMIGQGAIGNPWIFREIRCAWTGAEWEPPSTAERKAIIAEHLQGLYEYMSKRNQLRKHPSEHVERLACEAFRAHLRRYLHGLRGNRGLQRDLMQMATIDDVIAVVGKILEAKTVPRN